MKKFEIIISCLAVIAIILKFIGIPGSGLIVVLTLMTLAITYYFAFALFNNIRLRTIFKSSSYRYTNTKRIVGSVVLGLSLSLVIIGLLFKLQLWPGAAIQLNTGLVFLAICFIVAMINFMKSRDEFYLPLFKRIAVVGGFGLFILLTPDSALIDIYYRDRPELAELMKQSMADPGNDEIRYQLDSLRNVIDKNDQ